MSRIDEGVAREAAEWFLLLQSGEASAAEKEQLGQWLRSNPTHEQAWSRAQAIMGRLGELPTALASPVLKRRRPERRRALRLLAALIVAAPATWLVTRHPGVGHWLADHRTGVGEQRRWLLDDGSTLTLNTASAVDIRFDERQRLIRLVRGEILVTTAHRPATEPKESRPLIVETAHGEVRALGTRFIVRDLGARSLVIVLEGITGLQPKEGGSHPPGIRLQAGQQASFDRQHIDGISPAPSQPDAWTRGVLQVSDQRLADFLTELGRYRPGILDWDPAVADLRISGSFQLRDTDPILASLADALPVALRQRTRYWVTVMAAR